MFRDSLKNIEKTANKCSAITMHQEHSLQRFRLSQFHKNNHNMCVVLRFFLIGRPGFDQRYYHCSFKHHQKCKIGV